MAYYKKAEVKKYIVESNEALVEKNMKPLTDYEEAIKKIDNGEPLVGFMWTNIVEEIDKDTSLPSVKIKMDGRLFVKLDSDLYTDDRFAIDSYQAQLENVSVLEIISKREKETQEARRKVDPDLMKKIESYLKKEE